MSEFGTAIGACMRAARVFEDKVQGLRVENAIPVEEFDRIKQWASDRALTTPYSYAYWLRRGVRDWREGVRL